MDLISVVVPVYKVEKYLDRCVQSIVDQTWSNLEIILVDDGSPDNCGAMCDAWAEKDSRIKVIHKKNGGLSDARNAGMAIASGTYMGFVDSDDYVAPDMYSKLLSSAEKENADIAVCNFKRVFDDGSEENWVSWRGEDPLLAAGSCCDKIFRRSIVEYVRYPEGLWYEDFCFSAKLILKAKKIVHVNELNDLFF